jgi:hypothetical protein
MLVDNDIPGGHALKTKKSIRRNSTVAAKNMKKDIIDVQIHLCVEKL